MESKGRFNDNRTQFEQDDDEKTLLLDGSTVEEATTALPETNYIPTEVPDDFEGDDSALDRLIGDNGQFKESSDPPAAKRLRRM